MSTTRILLALTLMAGLSAFAACDSGDQDTRTDLTQVASVDRAVDRSLDEFAAARSEVLAGIDRARGQQLVRNTALDRAAARHALDLAGRRTMTHIGQDGSSPLGRAGAYGAQLGKVSEHIFRIEGEPTDLGDRALAAWVAPFADNAVLTDPATHIAVAFAESPDGGYVGVLLLAQR